MWKVKYNKSLLELDAQQQLKETNPVLPKMSNFEASCSIYLQHGKSPHNENNK